MRGYCAPLPPTSWSAASPSPFSQESDYTGSEWPSTLASPTKEPNNMSIIVKEQSQRPKQPPIPAGMHVATCYYVVDVGTHHFNWQGEAKSNRKVYLGFEVHGERITIPSKDGEPEKNLPRAISQDYTISLDKKSNLRKVLDSWRGKAFTPEELKGFDLKNILGAPCMLNLAHSVCGQYANIIGVVPMMKGMDAPKPENPQLLFSVGDLKEGVAPEWPENMPKWLIEKVQESDEYKALSAPAQTAPDVDVSQVTEAEMTGEEETIDRPF